MQPTTALFRFAPLTTTGDDAQRRERVLWAVLAPSIALAGLAVLLDLVALARDVDSASAPATAVTMLVFAGFLGLGHAARAGRHRVVAYALLAVYASSVVYMLVQWGADLPMAALIAALVVVLAGVLFGGRGAGVGTALMTIAFGVVITLQAGGQLTPDQTWHDDFSVADAIGNGAVLSLLALVGWLYTRDTGTSINEVVAGGSSTSPLERLRTRDLSVREVEVVRMVAEGLSNEAIGRALFVSPRTVQSHVANALRKTGTANRTELGVLAVREGLAPLRPDPAKVDTPA
jgi:DNA-binding CsgD family transcriptional regulator